LAAQGGVFFAPPAEPRPRLAIPHHGPSRITPLGDRPHCPRPTGAISGFFAILVMFFGGFLCFVSDVDFCFVFCVLFCVVFAFVGFLCFLVLFCGLRSTHGPATRSPPWQHALRPLRGTRATTGFAGPFFSDFLCVFVDCSWLFFVCFVVFSVVSNKMCVYVCFVCLFVIVCVFLIFLLNCLCFLVFFVICCGRFFVVVVVVVFVFLFCCDF